MGHRPGKGGKLWALLSRRNLSESGLGTEEHLLRSHSAGRTLEDCLLRQAGGALGPTKEHHFPFSIFKDTWRDADLTVEDFRS